MITSHRGTDDAGKKQQEKDLVLTLADVWEPMGQRLSPPLLFDVAPTSVTSSPLT